MQTDGWIHRWICKYVCISFSTNGGLTMPFWALAPQCPSLYTKSWPIYVLEVFSPVDPDWPTITMVLRNFEGSVGLQMCFRHLSWVRLSFSCVRRHSYAKKPRKMVVALLVCAEAECKSEKCVVESASPDMRKQTKWDWKNTGDETRTSGSTVSIAGFTPTHFS